MTIDQRRNECSCVTEFNAAAPAAFDDFYVDHDPYCRAHGELYGIDDGVNADGSIDPARRQAFRAAQAAGTPLPRLD